MKSLSIIVSGSFDVASIAFGIRNVDDPAKGIAEMARAVRSGGRVVVLELGRPQNRVIRWAYDRYCRIALPRLGGVLTGDRAAYEYLEVSSARFPFAEQFVAMMRSAADFSSIEVEPLTFGAAYLYCGVKR